jgi:peptide chain release factor 1
MRLDERLEEMVREVGDLAERMAQPEVASDPDAMREIAKRHAELLPLADKYRELQAAAAELAEWEALLAQDETSPEVAEEVDRQRARVESLEDELRRMLAPRDADADKNVIVEIRQGTGGEEAALFARDLYRMYTRYAERKRWRTDPISLHETGLGGIKEVIFGVVGRGAYGELRFESGTHRVQRVPETESSGRIHTSAVTVAVLPEVDDVEVHIDPKDLKIDTYRAAGAGGQHVQKNETAVRITHLPTGTVVSCQDERSQHQNKEKAMRLLRAQLYDAEKRRQQQEIADARRQQVGSGDRSEKIRTYNFPQNRVTDHRIGLTVHDLAAVMDGDIGQIIAALQDADEQARIGASSG